MAKSRSASAHVTVAFRVRSTVKTIAAGFRASGQPPSGAAKHLQALQDALLADAAALARWQELDAYMAVGRWYEPEADRGWCLDVDEEKTLILRRLSSSLSTDARAYFARALQHRAWLNYHPDGVAFVMAFAAKVVKAPVSGDDDLEETQQDLEISDRYSDGELPPLRKPGRARR